MRILFVNHWCGYFGGVEQNVATTARGLAARGHEVHLAFGAETAKDPVAFGALFRSTQQCHDIAGNGSTSVADAARNIHSDVIYLHKVEKLPDLEKLRAAAPRLVRMIHDHDVCCPRKHKYFAHNARICHHPAGWRCYLDAAFLAPNSSSPLKVAWRSLSAHRQEMRRNQELDALLVGSKFMQDELLMNGFPSDRTHVVAPVVPLDHADVVPVPPDGPMLYVGQLIRGKGVDLLLRAVARQKHRGQLQIVGDGNARAGLEKLSRDLGLADRVKFVGWVPNSDLPEHYLRAKLVVVPSRWPEPFGLIGLEAMRHGRPVVAFAAGGIPDWLENEATGLLAPEADVDALAAQLDRLCQDSQLADKLGAYARQRVHERFDFGRYMDVLEHYLSPTSDRPTL